MISEAQKVMNVHIALDMFLTNATLEYDRYRGSNLNYASIAKLWKGLTLVEQARQKELFEKIIRKCYCELVCHYARSEKEIFCNIIRMDPKFFGFFSSLYEYHYPKYNGKYFKSKKSKVNESCVEIVRVESRDDALIKIIKRNKKRMRKGDK